MAIQENNQEPEFEDSAYLRASLLTSGIYMAVTHALLNCVEAEEVCTLLERYAICCFEVRNELFTRLAAVIGSHPDQLAVVRNLFTRFMNINDADVAPSERTGLDATIGRLVRFLPAAEQVAIAPQFLMHRRKARRRTGAFMVGNHPEHCPPDMKETLLNAYAQRHDPEALVPLTRISSDVSDIAPMLLSAFAKLHDPQPGNRCLNEQARVFARLVTSDLPLAVALAAQYQTAFAFGVGKARQMNALPYVVDILANAQQRYERANKSQAKLLRKREAASTRWRVVQSSRRELEECIRLCIWTLGQLQARDVLQELASDYGARWLVDTDEDDIDLDEEME